MISSPTLGRNKVVRLLEIIQVRQERGVKAVIVTWHPDAYMYGRDEHRLELLDMLRNAGCIIHLVRENCEHFAIIDGEIVWYGSMNLLSKEDVKDNLMRVVSADIAAELMEMTFGKGRELIEIGL